MVGRGGGRNIKCRLRGTKQFNSPYVIQCQLTRKILILYSLGSINYHKNSVAQASSSTFPLLPAKASQWTHFIGSYQFYEDATLCELTELLQYSVRAMSHPELRTNALIGPLL